MKANVLSETLKKYKGFSNVSSGKGNFINYKGKWATMLRIPGSSFSFPHKNSDITQHNCYFHG